MGGFHHQIFFLHSILAVFCCACNDSLASEPQAVLDGWARITKAMSSPVANFSVTESQRNSRSDLGTYKGFSAMQNGKTLDRNITKNHVSLRNALGAFRLERGDDGDEWIMVRAQSDSKGMGELDVAPLNLLSLTILGGRLVTELTSRHNIELNDWKNVQDGPEPCSCIAVGDDGFGPIRLTFDRDRDYCVMSGDARKEVEGYGVVHFTHKITYSPDKSILFPVKTERYGTVESSGAVIQSHIVSDLKRSTEPIPEEEFELAHYGVSYSPPINSSRRFYFILASFIICSSIWILLRSTRRSKFSTENHSTTT
jgi:hypothetical protein